MYTQAEVPTAPGRGKVRSLLLNAGPEDTGSPTKRLRLTLGYAANLDKVGGLGGGYMVSRVIELDRRDTDIRVQ